MRDSRLIGLVPNVLNIFYILFSKSDIIILEYFANGTRISQLEKNETVSLKFRNKKGLDTKVSGLANDKSLLAVTYPSCGKLPGPEP